MGTQHATKTEIRSHICVRRGWNVRFISPAALPYLSCLSVCIFGTLRLIYSITTDSSSDYTWQAFYLWLFAALELDLAIICASAPALKMFVIRTLHLGNSESVTTPNIAQTTPPRMSEFIGHNRNEGLTSLCSAEISFNGPDEMPMTRNMYGMRRASVAPKRNSNGDDDIREVVEEGGEGSMAITKTVEFSFHEESTSNGDGSVGSQRGSHSRQPST